MPLASATVTLSKFVGTISLGLLTGLSYTLTTTTLPPLLSLPAASHAHTTFHHLRTLTSKNQLLLSTLSSTSLVLAYILSPPRRRHPFLLWATLCVALTYSRDIYGNVKARTIGGNGGGRMMKGNGDDGRNGNGNGNGSESSGEDDWEVEMENAASTGSLNGEVVREGMERWRGRQVVRGMGFAVAWGISVVGLWGDGAVFD